MKLHFFIMSAILLVSACTRDSDSTSVSPTEADHGATEGEMAKGPHGGRLLSDGNFEIEITIFESGVEPQYRAYAFLDEKPLAPNAVQLEVSLTRLDGKQEQFRFVPRDEYLAGDGVVQEPHSFTVEVAAVHAGKTHRWRYDSFEGRTRIAANIATESGIETQVAGPAKIREMLVLHGTVVPDPQRVFLVNARYPGVVREVRKRIGDRVVAGDLLAIIESNESLQRYNIVAPAAGIIISRAANPGQTVQDETLLTVADLSSVWVELAAFQHDLGRVRSGQPVTVRDVDGHQSASGQIESIAPVGSSASQSMSARVLLPNEDGRWRPGLLVTGEVVTGEAEVPVAVARSAMQTFRDWTVVFERVGDIYEVRPVQPGRSDAQWVEILEGITPGAQYVSANSYLIIADIEKSGASHDH